LKKLKKKIKNLLLDLPKVFCAENLGRKIFGKEKKIYDNFYATKQTKIKANFV